MDRGIRYLRIAGVVSAGLLAVLVAVVCADPKGLGSAKYDQSLLQAQTIAKAILVYRDRTGKYPDSLDQLVARPDGQPPFLEGDEYAIIAPWGKRFNFEVVTDEKGNERVVVWTTDHQGERIQWPRK